MFGWFQKRQDTGTGRSAGAQVISSETEQPNGRRDGLTASRDDGVAEVKLGQRTKAFDTNAPKRKHDRVQRIQLSVILFQTVALLVMAAALSSLTPLRRDIPYFVTVNPAHEQHIKVFPFRNTPEIEAQDSIENYAKAMAIRYVKLRHEVVPDSTVMNRRWGTGCLDGPEPKVDDLDCGFMWLHSQPIVYTKFQQENTEAVGAMIRDDIRRDVTFIGEPRTIGEQLLEIRFSIKDTQTDRQGRPILLQQSEMSVYIWYDIKVLRVEASQRYLNPWGFKVTKYERATQQSFRFIPEADPGVGVKQTTAILKNSSEGA